MRRRVNWTALAAGAIVASGGVLAGAALVVTEHERSRVVQIDVRPVPYAVDPAGEGTALRLPLPFKAACALGVVHDAAAKIDHRLPPARPVPAGVTVEHGAYVANLCISCVGAPRLTDACRLDGCRAGACRAAPT